MKKKIGLICLCAAAAVLIGIGIWFSVRSLAPKNEPKESVVLTVKNKLGRTDVLQKSFYADTSSLVSDLERIRFGMENGCYSEDSFRLDLEAVLRSMEQLGYYYDYAGQTAIVLPDGRQFGAKQTENDPIGGGIGYTDYTASKTFTVEDDTGFYRAVADAKKGDVIFIKNGAVIDLTDMSITDMPSLVIPEGVTIASDRGKGSSTGGVLTGSPAMQTLLRLSDGVRLTGLVIRGRDVGLPEESRTLPETYGVIASGSQIRIDNCEISGFSRAAILADDNGSLTVQNCYIHHVSGKNAGYGIEIGYADVTVSSVLFSQCRYSAVLDGDGNGSLTADNNVETGCASGAVFGILSDTASGDGSGLSLSLTHNTVLGYSLPLRLEVMPKTLRIEDNLFSLNEDQYDAASLFGPVYAEDKKSNTSLLDRNVFNILDPYLPSGETPEGLTAIPVTETEIEPASFAFNAEPILTSGVWYGDLSAAYQTLSQTRKTFDRRPTDPKIWSSEIKTASTEASALSRYLSYRDSLSYEIDGVRYGAYVEEGESPIGGGRGYLDILSGGDFRVSTLTELEDALAKAVSGQTVWIDGDAVLDLSALMTEGKSLVVPAGVTLASDRGAVREDGTVSNGARLFSYDLKAKTMFRAMEGARITGLTLDGGDPSAHMEHHFRSFSGENPLGSSYYYKLPRVSAMGITVNGDGVTIDNCEITGFGYAGIHINVDRKDISVHHCYLHHNQANGLGYGVVLNNGASADITYCLMNYNKHSIACTGAPGCFYYARFNVEMGGTYEHCFDMHGGADRGDGTDIAGTFCEMTNNTFLGDTHPYYLRGVPEEYQLFTHNLVYHPLSHFDAHCLYGERVTIDDNIFGISTHTLIKENAE